MNAVTSILAAVFVRNGWLKLLALALAVAFFFIAREETIREVDIEIPLRIRADTRERVLMTEPPAALRVLVRGDLQRLTDVLARKTPLDVDLSAYSNNAKVEFSPDALARHLGEDLEVLSISPASFTLQLDDIVEKRVPVAINILKNPGPFWTVVREKIVVEPRMVQVKGPESKVRKVKQVHTEPADLSEVTQPFAGKLTLEDIEGLTISPRSVRVEIPIEERHGAKTIPRAKMVAKRCPSGFQCAVSPAFFQVRVAGPERIVSQLTPENISQYVYVDAGVLPVEKDSLQRHFDVVEPTMEKLQGAVLELPGPKFFSVTLTRNADASPQTETRP
jgi:hypothetical protein